MKVLTSSVKLEKKIITILNKGVVNLQRIHNCTFKRKKRPTERTNVSHFVQLTQKADFDEVVRYN